MSKLCKKCGEIKPLSAFYKTSRSKDGRVWTCSTCAARIARENRAKRIEREPDFYEKEALRLKKIYHRDPKRWVEMRKIRPEKYEANKALMNLPRKKGIHRHHWSYNTSDILDIIELESRAHKKAHSFLVYCEDTFYFKTKSGALLDTRKKHEDYLSECLSA